MLALPLYKGDAIKKFQSIVKSPLWVVCGLTISAIERPLFHTNYPELNFNKAKGSMGARHRVSVRDLFLRGRKGVSPI